MGLFGWRSKRHRTFKVQPGKLKNAVVFYLSSFSLFRLLISYSIKVAVWSNACVYSFTYYVHGERSIFHRVYEQSVHLNHLAVSTSNLQVLRTDKLFLRHPFQKKTSIPTKTSNTRIGARAKDGAVKHLQKQYMKWFVKIDLETWCEDRFNDLDFELKWRLFGEHELNYTSYKFPS